MTTDTGQSIVTVEELTEIFDTEDLCKISNMRMEFRFLWRNWSIGAGGQCNRPVVRWFQLKCSVDGIRKVGVCKAHFDIIHRALSKNTHTVEFSCSDCGQRATYVS